MCIPQLTRIYRKSPQFTQKSLQFPCPQKKLDKSEYRSIINFDPLELRRPEKGREHQLKIMRRINKGQCLIVFLFLIFGCARSMDVHPTPSNELTVAEGEEFLIKKGQKARMRGTGFELEIINFYNQPCPPGVKCVWSGVGIEFQYRYHHQVKRGINLVEAFGFRTVVIKSDYESYAVLMIKQDRR